MAEGLERVRISASELRGILATLAPQAGSRGESHRPAPGPGLPAPPPSPPLPPPARSAALRSPRPFPQQWGRGAEGGPPRRPTSSRACVGVSLSQLWPPSDEPNQSACLRPLSYREGDCSPIAPALSDQPVDSQPSGDAKRSGRWGLVEAPGCIVPRRIIRRPAPSSLKRWRKRTGEIEEEGLTAWGFLAELFFPEAGF